MNFYALISGNRLGKGKRQVSSQTVEVFHHYYYATKTTSDSDTSTQMTVEFRLIFSIDCLTLICEKSTVQTVTTQMLTVIRFEESQFLTIFGLTTPSGGDGSSNNNSPASQIPPTSTVSNQLIIPTTDETRQPQPTSAFTKERPQTQKTGTNTTLYQKPGRTKPSPATKPETSKRAKPTKPSETKPESTSTVRSFTSLFSSKASSASKATSNQLQTESFTSFSGGT
ncbi:unnamed protein product [Didymodactylos carnosus]|uniref:Uncharacterized protein n=1 Tax=Didymodactylos carnosus TaxID=1234261 RepID=A0A815E9M3_9BILA|nr:unnamed protein product [Didymodactylos carnosus]CAF4143919.1 unnamed protein product [Didymodactylos carnosus]